MNLNQFRIKGGLRRCRRYVGNFVAVRYVHGRGQRSVAWLSDRISVFLVGNWAPGLQTQDGEEGGRDGAWERGGEAAGCQETRKAGRHERNTGWRKTGRLIFFSPPLLGLGWGCRGRRGRWARASARVWLERVRGSTPTLPKRAKVWTGSVWRVINSSASPPTRGGGNSKTNWTDTINITSTQTRESVCTRWSLAWWPIRRHLAFDHVAVGSLAHLSPGGTCVDVPAAHLYSSDVSPSPQRQTGPSVFAALRWAYLKESFCLPSYLHLTALRWRLAYIISPLPPADSEVTLIVLLRHQPVWASICGSLGAPPPPSTVACCYAGWCTCPNTPRPANTSRGEALMIVGLFEAG